MCTFSLSLSHTHVHTHRARERDIRSFFSPTDYVGLGDFDSDGSCKMAGPIICGSTGFGATALLVKKHWLVRRDLAEISRYRVSTHTTHTHKITGGCTQTLILFVLKLHNYVI